MVFPAGFCYWDIEIWDIGFWDIRVVGEIQPENQKTKFQTDHFSSILDCPKEGQRKFQPLRRKTGKRTEVFGRERLRKYSLSI